MSSYWLIGVGFVFGFAIILSALSKFTIENFLGYVTFLSGFMVWVDMFPLAIYITEFLILLFLEINRRV